jgi:glyoxylase-like metal-dependent hydrolase (beta-lactamase superfamily II)
VASTSKMTTHNFSSFQEVELHEFGFSAFGKPSFSVFCYLMDGLLIDTAQSHCRKSFLKTFKSKNIEQIALTHHHEDHSGNFSAIIEQNGIQQIHLGVNTATLIQQKLPLKPYEHYFFGNIDPYFGDYKVIKEPIETNRFSLKPIFSVGHSPDHVAFIEKNQGWLFAGDLWVGIKIKFFRQGEDFWQQVAGMKEVLNYDFDVIFCGHYPQLKNGKALMQQKLQYFEDFGGMVQELSRKGLNISEIIQKMNLKEATLARILTQNDVSIKYMIESAKNQ